MTLNTHVRYADNSLAQIRMLLQHAGADPPNFDFVLLVGSDLNP